MSVSSEPARYLLGGPLVTLDLSGVLFVVFSTILGATSTFRQLFSVVVHSGVVGPFGTSSYGHSTTSVKHVAQSHISGSLLPMMDEDSFCMGSSMPSICSSCGGSLF